MNVIPDLKLGPKETQNKNNEYKRNDIYTENLISIESSDEGELEDSGYLSIHKNGRTYSNEKEFQLKIDRLKLQSNLRFRNKWENILEKYSSINDDKDSDEIDLHTGKILKDNGHLKSLRSTITGFDGARTENNIWSPTYDIDKEMAIQKQREKKEKRFKSELKLDLKEKNLFYNSSLHRKDISNSNTSFILQKDEVKDYSTLEDNLVLLNPSPTKKPRLSPVKDSSSPIKSDHFKFYSPTKGSIPTELQNNSPIKEPTNFSYFDIKESTPKKENSSLESLVDSVNGTKEEVEQNHVGSSNILKQLTEARDAKTYSDPYASHLTNMTNIIGCGSSENEVGKNDISHSSNKDFDELFLIESNSFLEESNSSEDSHVYSCAFEICHYCTGNKYLYQTHLLQNHSTELATMGYPVDMENSSKKLNKSISKYEISKLVKDFPLSFNIPPLPLSIDGNPIKCNLPYKGNRCQKAFLSKFELKRHHEYYPNQCSFKTQVYICPLLGCGFMTDEGYLHFRNHFIEEKHHVLPNCLQDGEPGDLLDTSAEKEQSYKTDIDFKNEINDMFSESGSDISDVSSETDNERSVDQNKNIDNNYDYDLPLTPRKFPIHRKIINGDVPDLFSDNATEDINYDDDEEDSTLSGLFE